MRVEFGEPKIVFYNDILKGLSITSALHGVQVGALVTRKSLKGEGWFLVSVDGREEYAGPWAVLGDAKIAARQYFSADSAV